MSEVTGASDEGMQRDDRARRHDWLHLHGALPSQRTTGLQMPMLRLAAQGIVSAHYDDQAAAAYNAATIATQMRKMLPNHDVVVVGPHQIEVHRRDSLGPQSAATDQQAIPQLTTVKPTKPSKIQRPPGSLLLRVCEFGFSRRTFERVIMPVIADMRVEYFDALHERRPAKARWVLVRGYAALGEAILVRTPIGRLLRFGAKLLGLEVPGESKERDRRSAA